MRTASRRRVTSPTPVGTRMTEAGRRPRASKRELRLWAWVAGGLAFLAPAAVLGAAPKPPQDAARAAERPRVVIRKITRRIVITQPAASAPVRYVSGGTASSGSSSMASVPAATSTGGS
jgi:hypothetical protein